jgi:glycine/D-amino acid oxidase-like deaminating enzyme
MAQGLQITHPLESGRQLLLLFQVKTFVIGEELEECKRASGLVGIEDFDVGCIEPDNMTINTHSFCSSLQSFLEERGVKFHFGTTITRVMTDPDSDAAYPVIKAVCGVQLHTGVELPADDVVLCAGYETVHLLRTLGQKLALAPVKAYSLHIANPKLAAKEIHYATHLVSKSGAACLVTPYLNDPTGPGVRVTGIRDLDGFNGIHRPERVAVMVGCAQQVLGETSFDPEKDTQIWSGAWLLVCGRGW